MPLIFSSPHELMGKEGTKLGPTNWMVIDQDRINGFADVTGDHQWIHVDVERAKDGPFGATIAHGYLTLSLAANFQPQLIEVQRFSAGINIGADNLRFLAPVRAGSRIRGSGEIIQVEQVKNGAIQAVIRITIEAEGSEKPACVVDTISRYIPEDSHA